MCVNLHDRIVPVVVQLGTPRTNNRPDDGYQELYETHRSLCNLAHNAKAANRMQNYSALEVCIVGIERHVRRDGRSHTLNLMHAVRHTWLPHTQGVLD